jgi:uncharacterized membrane protein YgcG
VKLFIIKLALIIIVLPSVLFGVQPERIISFDSKIIINEDGSMLVTEIIKVHAEGNKIKRGIYRDFPTDYKDKYGNNIRISFDVIEVLRDGRKEVFHTERQSNGIRVYFGSSSYYLKPGDYTYTIKYKTDRQIGYFEDHDELYWNVTGNGWDFDIENVTATVILPKGINRNEIIPLAFTGYEGSIEKNYKAEIYNNGEVKFKTTRKLYSREGLTIVVQFPKGFVFEPDFSDKLQYYIEDNKAGIALIIGSLVLLFYYMIAWFIVGRDPAKGTIIPLYEPPAKLSPAAIRFIYKMGFDKKAFTAAIIDLCVKGKVILEEKNNEYKLIQNETTSNEKLSRDEQKLFTKLKFKDSGGKSILELKQENHVTIQAAIKALKKSLQNTFEKQYFYSNRTFFVIGLIISIVSLIIAGTLGNEELIFIMVWNLFWSIGVSVLLYTAFKSWRTALSGKLKGAAIAGAIFITLFAIPFTIGMFVGLYFLSQVGSVLLIFGILLIVLLNITFHHLLKAPTLLGRKIMDRIEGFKMYLSVAEQERLNSIKEPEKTPELFEKLLPYAVALDVENQWGEKFEDVLQKAGTGDSSYSPAWYSGATMGLLGASALSSSLGSSLTSTISSSSTAPGSSSGGGGGGFSGGGGGGGGGGGW